MVAAAQLMMLLYNLGIKDAMYAYTTLSREAIDRLSSYSKKIGMDDI